MRKGEKGFALYVNIMAAVQKQPLTRQEIANKTGIGIEALNSLLKLMTEAGLLHVASVTGRQHLKRWGFDGVRSAPITRSTLLAYANLWEAINKPASVKEIALITGQHTCEVYKITKRMREAGIIHIAGWMRVMPHGIAALYLAGKGRDAEKPAPKPIAIASRDHRRRQRWGEWASVVGALAA